MMPGDSQSKTVAIAADATVGNCQNCSVLHQSLTEYVSSFLALKQKITVSDDTIRLQQQLEELQVRLVTLQKKTADYESLQAELEEKRDSLKAYGKLSEATETLKQENQKAMAENKKLEEQLKSIKDLTEAQSLENAQVKREKAVVENDLLKTQAALKEYGQLSEVVEKLKEENSKTVAENKKLEDQLKSVKDLTESHTLENAQLKREKAVVENDLLFTQASLKKSQAQADEVPKLMEENAKLASIKDTLENKVRLLEDSLCKQNHEISQQTTKMILLERNIYDLQVRLRKMERERSKEYRSATTQASAPVEPKVDKKKFRMLLENLWECVEPEQEQSTNPWHFSESGHKQVLSSSPENGPHPRPTGMFPSASSKIRESHSNKKQTKATSVELKSPPMELKSPPQAQNAIQLQESLQCSSRKKRKDKRKESPKENKTNESFAETDSFTVSLEEIMELFKPIGPCISPLPDLDYVVPSMDIDDEEKGDPPEPSLDSSPLPRKEPVSITTSLSAKKSPKSCALPTEASVDMLEVTAQEGEHISNQTDSEDMEQTSGKAGMKDNTSTDDGKMELQNEIPSTSSRSDVALLVEVIPLTGNTNSVISESQNISGEAKEDLPEMVTTADVDISSSDVTDAKKVTREDDETARGSDAAVICEAADAELVAFSTPTGSLTDTTDPTEKNNHDSRLEPDSQDVTEFNSHEEIAVSICKDSEMPKPSHCSLSSTDGISSVSHNDFEERLENDERINLPEEDGIAAQGPGGVDVTDSPSGYIGDNNPPPANEASVLKEEDGESHADQELDSANVETPSKTDVDVETVDSQTVPDCGPSLSDSREMNIVNSDILKENTHPVCSQVSVLSTVQSPPNPEMQNQDKSTQHLSMKEETSVLSFEERGDIDKDNATEFSQDGINAGTTHVMRQEEPTPAACSTTAQSAECLGNARDEMGPPLPPLLTPLSNSPKAGKSINPRQAIGKLLFPSPLDGLASPTTPVQAHLTPNSHQQSSSSLNSPLPLNGVPSSPLQFGSATPKHAVPVPGRLPVVAMNSSQSSSSQENSMRILDTMYPELSARARTLSILRGNVGLNICSSESGALSTTTDCQMSGFKTVNSTSTAFTKTDTRGEKRSAVSLLQHKIKCPRLDSSSESSTQKLMATASTNSVSTSPQNIIPLKNETISPTMEAGEPAGQTLIVNSLKKIESQCFCLLPVIQGHLFTGLLPKKPILRDEEKEVIAEICQSSLADDMIVAILNKLKTEKQELSRNYLQALCRVYTGICRQKSYLEKAHILAYSILVEDFPDSVKLILFMVTTWPTVLSHSSSLCQAIHAIVKLKAQEELLGGLSTFLGWEKSPPCDVDQLISKVLSEIQSGANLSFTKHSRYGVDLGAEAWEHVFTLHLLCSHKKWKWTYENLLGKELWPLMNTWVTQPRDQQEPVSDACVATVLRLIGLLGQLGLRERCVSSVLTVANVINAFGRHGQTEGVPWDVQLAAVYCIHDLSPCDPKQALDALAGWREDTSQSVPSAVTSCINQLASVCRQVKM
ncbi:little elongation complex subunit 1 [Mugil cephalus]|uniref:little elongation complex subunit 1 n=1 Tax=Mugil cephalus TaxID=48193 RepID=UPI001FB7F79D|nr:little elongation complex subunit 1 [Mugil cephalus]